VTLIVNLAPRKMMGIESQGMILMAEDASGQLKLVQPSEEVFPGAVVK
jgi:methionyl-tRNA synthetase